MLKKTICALAAVLALGAVQADALEDWLPSDILVTQRRGEYPVAAGSVELCRVGELTDTGFLLGEEFGGGFVSMEDVPSQEFAFWLSQKAGMGEVRRVSSMGIVRFPGMEPGLYLVRQRESAPGYYAFRPYLVSVTGEMTLVDTYPVMELSPESNPRTAESSQPYLASLGVAMTLAGFIFWDAARRKDPGQTDLRD